MKKVRIHNRMYDVVTADEFQQNRHMYNPGDVAVIYRDQVLPYTTPYMSGNGPGYYSNDMANYPIPAPCSDPNYSVDNIIDFDNCSNVKELMSMNRSLKSIENEILASSDNIYVPKIREDDTPELIGLKEAIISKQIDINLYKDRFGPLFNNDKRIINTKNSITYDKLKSTASNLDIKVTLTFEDVEGCTNPIGRKIVVPLNYLPDEEDGDEVF